MGKKYTSEQFWKLFEKLPQELRDSLLADETGDTIYETCKKNEIAEYLEDVVDLTGQVLVGVLPPEDFQSALEKEVKLEQDIAKKVAQEINRFIFFPVKESLAALHLMGTAPAEKPLSTKPETTSSEIIPPESKPTKTAQIEEEKPKKEDTYREPTE